MDEKKAFIEAFRKRAATFAQTVYYLRLTDPVDMWYKVACESMDVADEFAPPSEEGELPPHWSQIKNSFFSLVEKEIAKKTERRDIL
jgi:hypothetical protein